MEKTPPWLKPLSLLAKAMKKNKKLEIAVYGGLVLVAALLYISALSPAQSQKTALSEGAKQGAADVLSGERLVEQRLEEVLSCIRGAGKVRVMVTYDTGVEVVPIMSTDTQTSTSESVTASGQTVNQNQTESQTPMTGRENEPLVLTERQPRIRGVLVVAEGAADIAVRINLMNAVQTVLGVDARCISVYEMKASDRSN